MDQRVFLRDIDDWELYAKGLEAHLGAWHEKLATLAELFMDAGDNGWWYADKLLPVACDVTRVLKEAADRSKRLADYRSGEADALTEHKLYPDET